MSARSDLADPYGIGLIWNGFNWVRVGGAATWTPEVGSGIGMNAIDGSSDLGIPGIARRDYANPRPSPAAPPTVSVAGAMSAGVPIPDGSLGIPVVVDLPDCTCEATRSPRSIWWLVGIGIVLWMM